MQLSYKQVYRSNATSATMQQVVGIPGPEKNTPNHPDSSRCIGYDVTTSVASSHRTVNGKALPLQCIPIVVRCNRSSMT